MLFRCRNFITCAKLLKNSWQEVNRISSVILESQAIGRPVGDVGKDILRLLDKTELPEGIEFLPEADLKFQEDAFGTLGIAILIAIALV